MIINTDNFAINFLPSKKRKTIFVAFAKVLLKPLQILYNTIFGTFKNGNTAANWSNATAYVVGNQVKYIDNTVRYDLLLSCCGPTGQIKWLSYLKY